MPPLKALSAEEATAITLEVVGKMETALPANAGGNGGEAEQLMTPRGTAPATPRTRNGQGLISNLNKLCALVAKTHGCDWSDVEAAVHKYESTTEALRTALKSFEDRCDVLLGQAAASAS